MFTEVIGRCPSGALRYQAPGIAGEQPDVPATIRAVERGPFLIRVAVICGYRQPGAG
jgi:hypothetical protein